MKVTMDIREGSYKSGMFSSTKTHDLHVHVEFTDVEKAAIKKLGIEKNHFMTYTPANPKHRADNEGFFNLGGAQPVSAAWFMSKTDNSMQYATLNEAQRGMQEFKEGLKNLKANIDTASAPTNESFEL